MKDLVYVPDMTRQDQQQQLITSGREVDRKDTVKIKG